MQTNEHKETYTIIYNNRMLVYGLLPLPVVAG